MSTQGSAMALYGGEALASEDHEAPRVEIKFDETVSRNLGGQEAGVSASLVPSRNDATSSLTDFESANQSIMDLVTKSLERLKQQRAESLRDSVRTDVLDSGVKIPGYNLKCVHNLPTEETLRMHPQHCPQHEQHVSAGKAGVFNALDFDGVKMTQHKVTLFLGSILPLLLNQAPHFTDIKLNVTSSALKVELAWEMGAAEI